MPQSVPRSLLMSRWCLAVILFAPSLLPAQPPQLAQPQSPGKLVRDEWETAYLDGYRVGYTRLTVQELTSPSGTKYLQASRDLNFSVKRGRDLARIKAVTGTHETADGTVLAVFMQQGLAAQVT